MTNVRQYVVCYHGGFLQLLQLVDQLNMMIEDLCRLFCSLLKYQNLTNINTISRDCTFQQKRNKIYWLKGSGLSHHLCPTQIHCSICTAVLRPNYFTTEHQIGSPEVPIIVWNRFREQKGEKNTSLCVKMASLDCSDLDQ